MNKFQHSTTDLPPKPARLLGFLPRRKPPKVGSALRSRRCAAPRDTIAVCGAWRECFGFPANYSQPQFYSTIEEYSNHTSVVYVLYNTCDGVVKVFLTIAFPALTFFATAAAEIRQRSPSEELGEHGKKRGKVGKFCIISDSQN
ncbi:DUF4708 domain-containing protein [Caenorhabditis elegans]|uniref:DUF4708 domain-containing protein n=1 Tax=Caenorhabditis elegans TaxID=6239 RepID=Q9TZC2_CAEEL|nr:DUF4708 domain-containing protein [Caenorhabditis elegans]CCD66068.1 DUF4708 domain-containing protein [Caenorhabditis elegans]|eukprot:NP_497141.1 Uncharacterized protein CELE_C29F9.9 [Caenorhabditis elegans]